MEKDTIFKEFIGNLVSLFGENENDYTIKHFKCEEKLTQGTHKDLIQITILIEIEKNK